MISSPAPVIIVVALLLFTVGLAGLIARSHLMRMVMGIEFLGKGVCLLFILGGYLSGDTGTSQAVVFTLIAIEAVLAGVALALIILFRRTWDTFESSPVFRALGGR
jgi:NADH-quinone oxidoreductase subunit K